MNDETRALRAELRALIARKEEEQRSRPYQEARELRRRRAAGEWPDLPGIHVEEVEPRELAPADLAELPSSPRR